MREKTRMVAALVLAAVAGCTSTGSARTTESAGGVSQNADAAGVKEGMRKLWADHVVWTRTYIIAAVADDPSASAAAARLLKNTDIATFLSGANPNWPRETLVSMLNEHLTLTTQEATARIEKDWAGDVAAFDKIFDQAMHMADALSAGIAKQFPDKV